MHVEREYNAAADYLTTKTLMAQGPVVIDDPVELAQLKQLNRIPEKLMKIAEPELRVSETEQSKEDEVRDVIAEPTSIGLQLSQ